jgi:hypothetical protein
MCSIVYTGDRGVRRICTKSVVYPDFPDQLRLPGEVIFHKPSATDSRFEGLDNLLRLPNNVGRIYHTGHTEEKCPYQPG